MIFQDQDAFGVAAKSQETSSPICPSQEVPRSPPRAELAHRSIGHGASVIVAASVMVAASHHGGSIAPSAELAWADVACAEVADDGYSAHIRTMTARPSSTWRRSAHGRRQGKTLFYDIRKTDRRLGVKSHNRLQSQSRSSDTTSSPHKGGQLTR